VILHDVGGGPGAIAVGHRRSMAPGQVIRIDIPRSSSRSAGTLPRNGGVTNVLQQGDLTELSFGYGSIDVVFPRWAVSPECHWKACDFGGPDPFLDAGRVFAVIQTSVDGRSDGTGTSGRAAHIGQWAGRVAASRQVFGPVGGVGTQPQVPGVGAAGEIAAVTNHGILGPRPPQSKDHSMGQLVGEQVSRDDAAS